MSHSVARPSLLPPPATSTSAWNMSRHALRGQPSVLEPPMITCDDKWSFTYGSPGVTRGYGDILAKKAHGISVSRGHVCAHPSRRNGSRKPWSVRGGCTAGGDRRRGDRRARRPPTSFIVPALVWVFAAVVDYDLWWRRGAAAPSALLSLPNDGNNPSGSVWGRAAKVAEACGGQFISFHVLLCLALVSHVAATVADPGFFARENSARSKAQPQEPGRWCDHCEVYKPPRAHHCRRCKACVARMDHHCIYVANCVGAGNYKQLTLFVLYSLACVAHAASLYLRLHLRCRQGSQLQDTLHLGVYSGGQPPARRGAAAMAGLLFVVLVFLAAVLSQQCRGIVADAGVVDRMQTAAAASAATSTMPKCGAAEQSSVGLLLGMLPPAPAPAVLESRRGEQQTQRGYLGADACGVSGFQAAVDLPRGRLGRKIASGDTSSCSRRFGLAWRSIGEGCVRLSSCCRDLRQEVLGEGPWFTWFLPTPAVLSVEAEERAYAPYGKAGRTR